jgi:hypothetical protein
MDLSSTSYGFEFAKPNLKSWLNLKSWFKKPGELRTPNANNRVMVRSGEQNGRLVAGTESRYKSRSALRVGESLVCRQGIGGDFRLE